MNVMRLILSHERPSLPLYRMLNQEVIEQFAELLRRRVWHVHEPPIPLSKPRGEPEDIPPDPDPGGGGNAPVPSEPDDNDDLLNELDEAAIAAALKLAALLGIPLCEECQLNPTA